MLSKQFLFTFCQLDLFFWVVKLLHTKLSAKRSLVVRDAPRPWDPLIRPEQKLCFYLRRVSIGQFGYRF